MSNSDQSRPEDQEIDENRPASSSGSIRGLLISMMIGLVTIVLLVAVELSRRP